MRLYNCCVFVVGCGGIGGYLCELLPQVMACINLDRHINRGDNRDVSTALNSEGITNNVPNVFEKLVLIDGDDFSGHNALRQQAVQGSKLVVQMNKIRNKDAFTTWLNNTELKGYQTFITPENSDRIFRGETNLRCDSAVVFLCVDNHKTRFEVSKYFESFDKPVLIINGGNKKISGNVTVWAKKWGTTDLSYLDPPIYKVYPEVNDKHDLRPDEVDCGTVTLNNDQTAVTNNMIASIMLSMFSKGIINGFEDGFMQETRRKDENGNVIKVRKNEVIVDFSTMTMQSLSHSKDLDNTKLYSILEGTVNEEQLN